MTSITTKRVSSQLDAEATCRLFDNWFDPIETEVRARARWFIEELIRNELDDVLARPATNEASRPAMKQEPALRAIATAAGCGR